MDTDLGNQGGWPHAAMRPMLPCAPCCHADWFGSQSLVGPAAELAGNGCDDAPDSCVSDRVVGGDKTFSLITAE
jgi:hypothetical protein